MREAEAEPRGTQRAMTARWTRWAGRAALGALLAWVLLALVNWLTGRFWWWGGAVPLLLFFTGPVVVLGSVPMLLLVRSPLPRPQRALISLSVALVALTVLRGLLSGHTWLWVVPDLMVPPLLYAALPVTLLVALLVLRLCRVEVARATHWWTVVPTAAALVLALVLGQAGLNAPWNGGGDGPAPAGALHVVSWDTYCWDTTDDPARFFRYLRRWRADVYLLQEHAKCAPGAQVPLDDSEELRREFPGYHFAADEGLLTISRLPIVSQTPVGANPNPYAANWTHAAMRTDVRTAGRVLSIYNAHFYDMLYLSSSPLTPEFYRAIETLDAERQIQLRRLVADIDANPHPVLASGNLNILPGTGLARRLDHLKDASRAGNSPYPATLTFAGLRLWKMDWTLTSRDVNVHRYDLRSPEGMSSHHLQDMVVSLATR
ncbi:endonuclease/exonuclease/phosphatase family protein [Planotetraspora sp. GP83]|uniref:endonuclease/exonuclease/phosphatase family protein n=1 Tax=Planotetraspora sp. GP83 TaxID=3156264 RepID=UPI003515B12B